MSKISETEIKAMTKEQNYIRGYKDGKSDVLDKIRAEIEQVRLHKAQFLTNDNKVCIDSQEVLEIIDKYKAEQELEKL